MTPVLQSILDSKTVLDAAGNRYPVHSQIPADSGEFLQRLIAEEKPHTSLEVGLAYGISALYICEALAAAGAERHIIIDPLQNGRPSSNGYAFSPSDARWDELGWSPTTGWRGIGLSNLHKAGFGELVEFHAVPGHFALPKLVEENRRIDFAFIDGWHTFDYVLLDFFYVDMLLRPGGVIAFDDSDYPAIRKVLRYILTNRRYQVVDMQRTCNSRPPSWKRRFVRSAATRLPRFDQTLSPSWLQPDAELGLPKGRCIALRKLEADVLGDGSGNSRSWNFHNAF